MATRNKIDFTSSKFVRKWFQKREKDTLPVEKTHTPAQLQTLWNNIAFTKMMFPDVLAANIREGMPTEEDKKLL